VWDPKKSKTISAKTQQSVIDYNVFEGQKVTGLPRYTLTRGHVAIDDGAVKTREGHGEFVARKPNGAVNQALSRWSEVSAPRPVQRTGVPASGV
jgi:dihydropyrimidinase